MFDRSNGGEQHPMQVRVILAALGVCALSLVSSRSLAEDFKVDRRCEVFTSPSDRAGCACALQQGGWVTKVHGRWRWIYPRRHQERHCHGVTAPRNPSQS